MKAVITTATLDIREGTEACEIATRNAGIECDYVVAYDERRDGGVKTANRAWAEALQKCDPEFLCYINDDVRADQKDWLKLMIDALEAKPEYGIAGVSGSCGTEPQRSGRPGLPFGIVEVAKLSFFCAVIKRAVIDELGLLDSVYIHWGCDADYCLKAREAGWKVIWVQHVYLEHDFTPIRERSSKLHGWLEHDLSMFKERWNRKDISY